MPAFTEIKPDLSLELRTHEPRLTFDLLVELDLTDRPSYNHDKFKAYDAFLTGWALAHPRYRALKTRPAVVFVSRDHRAALSNAREADRVMTGRIGVMGTPAHDWHHAGREHVFVAAEPDLHRGSRRALALPSLPPKAREDLGQHDAVELAPIQLIGDSALRVP